MKPLSIRLLALAGLTLIATTGFTPKPAGPKAAPFSTPMTNTTVATATTLPPISAATIRWINNQSFVHAQSAIAPMKKKWDISYYFFTYPDDTYVDYNTVASEEWNLSIIWGCGVDTDSRGGTLLEKGYLDYGWPHGVVYVFLWGHFGY